MQSKLQFTQYLEESYARKLLNIVGHLDYYNEIVDESRWYFHETFNTDLDDANRNIIHSNLNRSYLIIGERARDIATDICSFV